MEEEKEKWKEGKRGEFQYVVPTDPLLKWLQHSERGQERPRRTELRLGLLPGGQGPKLLAHRLLLCYEH